MFKILQSLEDELRTMWQDPTRGHHGIRHLGEVLADIESHREAFFCPYAAIIAAWYHDAIMDPSRKDNELRSAELMKRHLSGLIDSDVLKVAEAIILATEHHDISPEFPENVASDCALFIDIDMAVLGSNPARYDEYAAGVAFEYVPIHGVQAYHKGRRAFLEELLDRDRIFLSVRFEESLGGLARQNMAREIVSIFAGHPAEDPKR